MQQIQAAILMSGPNHLGLLWSCRLAKQRKQLDELVAQNAAKKSTV